MSYIHSRSHEQVELLFYGIQTKQYIMSFLLRGISGIGSAVGLGGGGILGGIGKGVKSITSGVGSAVGGIFKGVGGLVGSIFGGARQVANTAYGGFKFLTSPMFIAAAVGGTVLLIVLTRS